MTTAREFHIGDILSVTGEALVSPRHINGVADLLAFLTDDDTLMTHQLPRVAREAAPFLREQFPDLNGIEFPTGIIPAGATMDEAKVAVMGWLDTVVAEHGETRVVARMPAEHHARIGPINEFLMMRGDTNVKGD